MAGFFCAPLSDAAQKAFVAYVNANGSDDGNGALLIPGPIEAGGLCLRNVSVIGAFGVILASGTACASAAEGFIRSVAAHPGLTPLPQTPPQMLAAFEISNGSRAKGSLVIFSGAPSAQAAPDPASRLVSYSCSRREGGSQ